MNNESLICNACGKTLDIFDIQNDFSLHRHIQYGSVHDGEVLNVRFCCDCMDKIISVCRISPVTEE